MRILLLTNMYPTKDGEYWKGIFVKEQVDALSSESVDIQIDVIHIKGASSKGGSNFNYLIGAFRYLIARFASRYDLVWSHHAYCVFLASIWRGCPILYTVHEGVIKGSIKYRVVDYATRLSSYVLYVNKGHYDDSDRDNKFYLPCGVDVEKFCCLEKVSCRQQLGLNLQKYYVFFPASPRRSEKNASFAYSFIEERSAWLSHENIEFVFGGDIEYEKMPVWMNAVDCLVSFSDFESDGMVFKEAMACDLPVITFEVGNASIYFKNELAGSVIAKSHNSLQEKIAHWKGVGKSKGRDYLLSLGMDKFSVARQLNGIFNEVANGGV